MNFRINFEEEILLTNRDKLEINFNFIRGEIYADSIKIKVNDKEIKTKIKEF